MKGPFLYGAEIKSKRTSTFQMRDWLVPAVRPENKTSQSFSDNWSDFSARFVYRQARQITGWQRPLPYDTYGIREVVRPTFASVCRIDYKNPQYPWSSPFAYQYVERKLAGSVPDVPLPGVPLLPDSDPEGLLINACLSKASDTAVNLAVTLAEMDKTASMISSRARKLSRAITHIRKGRFRKAADELGVRVPKGVSTTKRWSDNFLEYTYGWMPLISDVSGAARFLAEFMRSNGVLTVSAKTDRETTTSSLGTYRAFKPHAQQSVNSVETVDIKTTTVLKEYHHVVLNFSLKSSFIRELEKLGSLNPAVAAWELVPFSFVVDWFVSVQDVLASRTALAGLDFLSGSYSRMARSESTVVHQKMNFPVLQFPYDQKYGQRSFSSTDGVFKGWNMRRTTYDSVPPPELIIAIPTTRQWQKAVVSAALLRQRIS